MVQDTINNDPTIGGANATLLANRYRVVRQLGQGGMGSVWLAEDVQLKNHRVAIKLLPSVLISNEKALSQLKDEALTSMELVHPNIVPIRSFEDNKGNPFLVMDYVDGRDLASLLQQEGNRFTETDTVALLLPIARALDYAHARGVIHRDVKPGNIIVGTDGTTHILDFGIARHLYDENSSNKMSGTLVYMSPEQQHGDDPSPAQDVYSLAAIAYECLLGYPPLSRDQIEQNANRNTIEPLPFGIGIARAVMAALDADSSKRPTECEAIFAKKAKPKLKNKPSWTYFAVGLIIGLVIMELFSMRIYNVLTLERYSHATTISAIRLTIAGLEQKNREQGEFVQTIVEQARSSAKGLVESLNEYRSGLQEYAYVETQRRWQTAEDLREAGDFEGAYNEYGWVIGRAKEEIKSAKPRILQSYLAQAKKAEDEGRWNTCLWTANEMLSIDDDNVFALSLRERATENLRPSATMIAVLGNREVQAEVTVGDRRYSTPVRWPKMTRGNYMREATITFSESGKMFDGYFPRTTVDWDGARTIKIQLHARDVHEPLQTSENSPADATHGEAEVGKFYIVQQGDYLARISRRLNATISSLKRLNPCLSNDVVRVGQRLAIPSDIDDSKLREAMPMGTEAW